MRRLALFIVPCVGLLIIGGCRSDGRTLRDARPDQDKSISTTIVTTTVPADPAFIDPDDSPDSVDPPLTLPDFGDGLTVTAPWRDDQSIDARYTCDGLNVAPPLTWSDAPEGTVEVAVSLTDLDAPSFVHWVIAGIPPTMFALDEDTVPLGAYEANNGQGGLGYTGPCPPAGTEHTYVLTVHYLGDATGLDDGAAGAELLLAIKTTQIASAELAGTFSRP